MAGAAWIFFALLAITLLLTYLAIRREWLAPGVTAVISVIVSMILTVLVSLGQGNSIIQAVVVGILVGGMFSGAVLGIAWYFHSNEMRQRAAANQD
jgi:hypothetical protein